ncbi:MAG: hypothetical protein ACK51F_10610 [Rhodospirillales bacterium]|jgi:uncharacterized small protein (DUF1192 family)
MIARLLADLAVPPWLRVFIAPALIAVGAIAAWLWFAGHYYDQGYAARSAEVELAGAEYSRRIAVLNAEIARIGAETDRRVAQARAEALKSSERIQTYVQRHPEFAAVRRPADFHAERVRDLDDLARAATDRDLR